MKYKSGDRVIDLVYPNIISEIIRYTGAGRYSVQRPDGVMTAEVPEEDLSPAAPVINRYRIKKALGL